MKIMMKVEDVALTMAQPSQVSLRLHAILNGKHTRRPVARWTMAALFVSAGVILPLLAAAQTSQSAGQSVPAIDGKKARVEWWEELNYGPDRSGAAKAVDLKILHQGMGNDLVPISQWTELSNAQFLVTTLLYNDAATLQTALDKGINVNSKMEHGITALHAAVAFRRTDMVKVLLRNGADINAQAEGVTPLDLMALPPKLRAQTGQDQQILQILKQGHAINGSSSVTPTKKENAQLPFWSVPQTKEEKARLECASNLKQIALGAFQMDQRKGKLAMTSQNFEAQMFPYLHTRELFRCPSMSTAESFSFNGNLTNLSLKNLADSFHLVMFYEGRNGQLDFRHDGKTNVAFADGHVQTISREEAKTLQWKP